MPRRALALPLLCLLVACPEQTSEGARQQAISQPEPRSEPEPWSDAWLDREASRYLDDPQFRRSALEASLTSPDNLYSTTRLTAYGLGDRGWDQLPVWAPRTAPITTTNVQAMRRGEPLVLPQDATSTWDGKRPSQYDEWVTLGRKVFFEYPLRPEVYAEHALSDEDRSNEAGLGPAADGTWPGVVAFEDLDGATRVGITCALCHVDVDVEAGHLIEGRARRDFDYGRMRLGYYQDTGRPLDPELAERMRAWGPGRADITQDDDEDPVAIVDLWNVRGLQHLTQAATLTHQHPAALAIRQETQILHANRERTRPPRELAWALAMYVYSLDPQGRPASPGPRSQRGASVFRRECASCHRNDDGSGPPLDASRVGTDPALAMGSARGTGLYRPSPLVRVAAAGPYLHDGSVATLEDLFSARRFEPDYEGPRGTAAVVGHRYGVDLDVTQRDDLLAYLRTR